METNQRAFTERHGSIKSFRDMKGMGKKPLFMRLHLVFSLKMFACLRFSAWKQNRNAHVDNNETKGMFKGPLVFWGDVNNG